MSQYQNYGDHYFIVLNQNKDKKYLIINFKKNNTF